MRSLCGIRKYIGIHFDSDEPSGWARVPFLQRRMSKNIEFSADPIS